jgi:uncharacterized membrane protein YeaQ/YmgE (transglycosylase-associated protein family)
MSIRLPKYRSDSSRTNEPNNLIIVSSLVIGLLAGATGTYFFEHGFHESGPVLLGIVGILAGGTISGWHNWCKFDRARRAHTVAICRRLGFRGIIAPDKEVSAMRFSAARERKPAIPEA